MTEKELREMDAWIAENVFGWSDRIEVAKGSSLKGCGEFRVAFKTYPFVCGDYSAHVTKDGTKIYCGRPFSFRCPPHYSTGKSDAMEVLEKCSKKCGTVTWFDEQKAQWVAYNATVGTQCYADTLPLAICLFAKKLFSK